MLVTFHDLDNRGCHVHEIKRSVSFIRACQPVKAGSTGKAECSSDRNRNAHQKTQVLIKKFGAGRREDGSLVFPFCSHTGCSCQTRDEGRARCNEQDYWGRLAGTVRYQRKSSQRWTALPFLLFIACAPRVTQLTLLLSNPIIIH